MLLKLPRLLGCTVSRLKGSRDPGRQLARYRAPSMSADSSMRHAWNTTRRRHRLCSDRSASYPLLATRKLAPTVTGDRRVTSVAPGVSSGSGWSVGRQQAPPASALPTPSLASRLPTNPGLSALWLFHQGRAERSPPPPPISSTRTRWCPLKNIFEAWEGSQDALVFFAICVRHLFAFLMIHWSGITSLWC